MYTHNYIRCNHHKPPYKTYKCFCCRIEQETYLSSYNAKIPIQMVNYDEGNPQSTPAIRHPETASITSGVHNDSNCETDAIINTATIEDPPDIADSQRLMEEDITVNVQNIVESGASNATTVNFDDDKHTEKDDQSDDSPLMSEAIPLSALSGRDIHTTFPAQEQPVNMIMDAASRLTDAVAQFIEAADTKSHDSACGLLHFREWWELVGVNICVGGKQISGIPIFIEEDTLRVIDNNYSYFIPLGKVDYIRTNDGLRSGFRSPDIQPT